jgi:hypothetical protein
MPIKAAFFTNCLSLGKKFAKMLFYFINKSDISFAKVLLQINFKDLQIKT